MLLCLLAALSLPPGAQVPIYEFFGDSPGDRFGHSVSGAGDLNGDGHGDLIISARLDDLNGVDSGTVYVRSGLDGALLYLFTGDSARVEFGSYVNEAGDVDGDGIGDLIVGAKADIVNGPYSGSARVFSGADGSTIHTFHGDAEYDFLGQSVCSPGDVDLDGFDDLLVGARESFAAAPGPGYVRLFSGRDGAVLRTIYGDDDYDWFGKFCGAPGDVDLDGVPDLLVGAKEDDNAGLDSGSARVYSGADGSILFQWDGTPGSWFGTSVNGAGDVNADGYPDVIIGAYRSNVVASEAGRFSVFSGADGAELYTYFGSVAGEWFGKSVDGLGDVNGDGFDDFAAAGYKSAYNGTNTGLLQVYSGVDGEVIYSSVGMRPASNYGYWVNSAGDVNADGTPDLVVGARSDDLLWTDGGSAQVVALGVLQLAEPAPGLAGVPNTVAICGATPGATISFAYSTTPGLTLVPGCAPAIASLEGAALLGRVDADAGGCASIVVTPPAAASGRTVWLQAMDGASCTVSNLVRFQFP